MKIFIRYAPLLFSLILISGCLKEDKTTINKAVWSSKEPLNIPLKKRWSEYRDMQKVFNGSFEQGRVFNDNFHTFEINGWSKVGENIEWVDTAKKHYRPGEVFTGSHSIKISSPGADETGDAENGLISDYLRVISGNYRLSFALKLKKVRPYNARLGSRMLDAVNIRLLYYDKNKIQLEGKTFNPIDEQYFDNEFKALPLAGFWQVDSLGWHKAKGISYKYPYADGDIPDETRYVRIFFGLKGSGTMWIDDVELNYTAQNFSLKELTDPFRDSSIHQAERLFPTPRKVQLKQSFRVFKTGRKKSAPVVVIPEGAGFYTRKGAELLQKRLNQMGEQLFPDETFRIKILRKGAYSETDTNAFRIFLGVAPYESDTLIRKLRDSIRGKQQGYFLTHLQHDHSEFYIGGNSDISFLYGSQTLVQLFSEEENLYHHAEIIDYPSFTNRGVSVTCGDSLHLIRKILAEARITQLYKEVHKPRGLADFSDDHAWHDKQSDVHPIPEPGIVLNPYRYNQDSTFVPRNAQIPDLNKVLKKLQQARKSGIDHYILRFDDTFALQDSCACIYKFISQKNHLAYQNMLDVHRNFINQVSSMIGSQADLKVMPLWNDSECIRRSQGRGEMYLKELFKKIPGNVDYLWTGPSSYPFVIDEVEVAYIRKMISKKPVYYSKSINPMADDVFDHAYHRHFPGKIRGTSIFEPFKLNLPEDFGQMNSEQSFIAEMDLRTELDKIKLATYADYLWNTESYSPHRSLVKVLVNMYGEEAAFSLLKCNEYLQGMKEMFYKARSPENKRKYLRTAENFLVELDRQMDRLEELLHDDPVLLEIRKRKKQVEGHFNLLMGHQQ